MTLLAATTSAFTWDSLVLVFIASTITIIISITSNITSSITITTTITITIIMNKYLVVDLL